MKKKHPFSKYFRRHGHYPQLKFDSGVQKVTVEFTPGYIRIKTSYPYSGEVYLVRSAWLHLLRRAVPLTRHWSKHRDFDVPLRVHEAYVQEQAHLEALRQQKRDRVIPVPDPKAERRKHDRYLRAKARGRGQSSDA